MADNKKIAADVLEAVGGKSNVSYVAHCMTRLRFTLKDRSKVDEGTLKRTTGVLGFQETGGQYQVIIGQNVPKVYNELCAMSGLAKQEAIDENLDTPAEKEKLTPKLVGKKILDYLSGSMVPLIPIFLTGGLSRAIASLIGPTLLNLVSAESDVYILFYDLIYNAAFSFIPLYLGYTAAKKIGATPVLGLFLGGIYMSPTFATMVTEGTQFTIFGIPVMMASYSQTVLPIVLSVPVLYLLEKGIRKIMPDVLTTVVTPFCTIIIMVPICFLVLGPIGRELGTLVSTGILALGDAGGPIRVIGMTIIGGIWQLLVITGMHIAIIQLAKIPLLEYGYEAFVYVASNAAMLGVWGMALGAFLRIRRKEEKSQNFGFLVSGAIGGVTEPALFGLALRYTRPLIGMIAGGAAGGLFLGLTNVVYYNSGGGSNILFLTAYLPGGQANVMFACIGFAIAFVVAAVVTYLFGFKKEDLDYLTEKTA